MTCVILFFSCMSITWILDRCRLVQNFKCPAMAYYKFTSWASCHLQNTLNMIICSYITSLNYQKVSCSFNVNTINFLHHRYELRTKSSSSFNLFTDLSVCSKIQWNLFQMIPHKFFCLRHHDNVASKFLLPKKYENFMMERIYQSFNGFVTSDLNFPKFPFVRFAPDLYL